MLSNARLNAKTIHLARVSTIIKLNNFAKYNMSTQKIFPSNKIAYMINIHCGGLIMFAMSLFSNWNVNGVLIN